MAYDPTKFKRISNVAKKKTTLDKIKETSLGTLQNVIEFVRTGEYAAGGVLSGVGAKKGIERKISPSDALGITNAATRFATDVLLDPTTYVTFGTGGGLKIATKAGTEVVLNSAGKKAFAETVKKVGAKNARQEFAKTIATNPQYLDKGGLKFAGKTIISQKALQKVTTPTAKTLERIPLVKTAVEKVRGLDEFAEIRKLPGGAELEFGFKALPKKTRAEVWKRTDEVAKLNSAYEKKWGKEFGKQVTDYMETGKVLTKNTDMANDIVKIGDELINTGEVIAKAEMGRGLLKTTLGETILKYPKAVKNIVEEYSDNIINGTIKTADDFKSILSKGEKTILKGKYSPKKIFEKIISTKPNVENYVKHFLTDAGRKYIKKGGDFYGAIPKPLRAKLQSSNMRTLRSAISQINDEMRDKVGGDFFEPNAFKSMAAREAESIKAINIFDFIDKVKNQYGIPAIDGETDRIIDGVKYVRSTNPQLNGMLIPEPIAKHVDDTTKFINGDKITNEFLSGYDKLLRLWKGSVTGLFPAFHTRNFMGGAFNNWLAGIDHSMYIKARKVFDDANGANKLVHLAADGKEYTSKELVELMNKTGSIGQTGLIDVMKEIDGKIDKNIIQKFGEYPRALMEMTENNLRAPLFLDRVIKRGWSPEQAAKDVFKFHFDYAPEGLSTFERMWMKRLLPFYTWTRNNIPLQIEMMMRTPGKFAGIGKLQDAIGGEKAKEEFVDLPDWMKEQLNFRVGENNGLGLWLQLNLPIEDIGKLPINEQGVREIVSTLSPVLKIPVELITNKNLYFGTDIVNEDLKDYPDLQRAKTISQIELLPEPIKNFLNVHIVKKKTTENGKVVWKKQVEMDAKKLYTIKALFGRFYSAIDQIGGDETEAQKVLRLIGGVPLREVDIETQKYWKRYYEERANKAKASYEKVRIEEEEE